MDRSQSLNAPPYFDGSNYAFWKVRMKAFLCSIDEGIWDAVEIGWTRSEEAKSTWDKAALTALKLFFFPSSFFFLYCNCKRTHGFRFQIFEIVGSVPSAEE